MIPRLVELYKQGNFPIDKLSKVYPAEQLAQALEDLKTGKVRSMPIFIVFNCSAWLSITGIPSSVGIANNWRVGD